MSETLTPADLAVRERAFDIVNKLWNRPDFQRLAKEADPTIRTAADVAEPFVAPVRAELEVVKASNTALTDRIDKFLAGQTEMAEDTKFRAKLGDTQSKYRLTDDGMNDVMALMKERQIADPEAAAALWQANQPKPKVSLGSSLSPSSMQPSEIMAGSRYGGGAIMSEESMKLLNTKPLDWMTAAAIEILNEPEAA